VQTRGPVTDEDLIVTTITKKRIYIPVFVKDNNLTKRGMIKKRERKKERMKEEKEKKNCRGYSCASRGGSS
jgi:hypothetical protein